MDSKSKTRSQKDVFCGRQHDVKGLSSFFDMANGKLCFKRYVECNENYSGQKQAKKARR